jgi:hypothetical protein
MNHHAGQYEKARVKKSGRACLTDNQNRKDPAAFVAGSFFARGDERERAGKVLAA